MLATRSIEEGLSIRSKRPQSASGARRHMSDYARMNAVMMRAVAEVFLMLRVLQAMGDRNPRYKTENIITLELDLPERTTFDFDRHSMTGEMHSTIQQLWCDERFSAVLQQPQPMAGREMIGGRRGQSTPRASSASRNGRRKSREE